MNDLDTSISALRQASERLGREQAYAAVAEWWQRELDEAQQAAFDADMSDSRGGRGVWEVHLLWRMGEQLLGIEPPSPLHASQEDDAETVARTLKNFREYYYGGRS